MDTFDPNTIRNLDKLVVDEARAICLELINSSNTKEPKKSALVRDIQAAPTSAELSRIMWNVLLSGEGMAIATSAWQKMFK